MAFEACRTSSAGRTSRASRTRAAAFREVGVLMLLGDEDTSLEGCVGMLREVGIRVDVLDGRDLGRRFPDLHLCGARLDMKDPESHACRDLCRASFEPEGGYADPVGRPRT